MNTTAKPKQPVETIRDGSLKATIWQNEGDHGPYYTTTLAKTYEDRAGKPQDTHSFTGPELLRIAELARTAYARSVSLRRQPSPQNQSPETDHSQSEVSLSDTFPVCD